MLKGAVIGCGFFAENHLHAWRDISGAEIAALCDTNPARLEEVGAAFGVAARFTDAREMLASQNFDFVDIVTTLPSHRPLVELAANHSVHIICQKPFAETLVDGRAMSAAAETAGVTLMVHENFRWQSPIRAVRQRIESGAIGRPFWGRVSFRSAHDVYTAQPYLATDEKFIIQDLGIHILDVARSLFGDVAALSATTRRVNPAIRAEDVATMLLQHETGVTSVVDCSYATRLPEDPFPQTLLEVDGSEGTLRLAQCYRLTETTAKGTQELDLSPPVLAWAQRPWHNIQESVLAIQADFVDCLTAGRSPETSGRDNLKTLELVYAAYESAGRAGATISLAGAPAA